MRKFSDKEVTTFRYRTELTEALNQKWDTVLIFQDCCFSEDNTRKIYHQSVKSRFVAPAGVIEPVIIKHAYRSVDMKWLAFSACQDYQTASDAYISGNYAGAFTYFCYESIEAGYDLQGIGSLSQNHSWHRVPLSRYPNFRGPDYLMNKKVFSDKTLVVHYSGHGTFVKDRNGDEADGQDEAMYLYDGALLDDELSLVICKIESIRNQKLSLDLGSSEYELLRNS